MSGTIIERKRNYNKDDQEFECERLFQNLATVVLRYVTANDYTVAGRQIKRGSATLGLYSAGKNYVLWKMLDPSGRLQAHLFHICEPVELEPDRVIYRDLMLDVWQSPGEEPELLDKDELEAAVIVGLIPAEKADEARRIAECLLADLEVVIKDGDTRLDTYLERSSASEPPDYTDLSTVSASEEPLE